MDNPDSMYIQNSQNYSQAKAAKQASILENEISQLKNELTKINRLTNCITEMIGPSPVCNPSCEGEKNPVNTVANSLKEIRSIAEESRAQLEGIGKCLEEHLGSLKLEY